MTPGKAIRKHCVDCVDSVYAVVDCMGDRMLGGQGSVSGVCYFFPYRLGRGRPSVKTIRKFCLECQGGDKDRKVQAQEVRDGVKFCPSENCTLFPFRMGKNPNFKPGPVDRLRPKKRLSGVTLILVPVS